jgi:hypothetical protein
VHKFQLFDVGVIKCGQQLTVRVEVKIDNFGLGYFCAAKHPHDDAYQFLDIVHHKLPRCASLPRRLCRKRRAAETQSAARVLPQLLGGVEVADGAGDGAEVEA